MKKNLRPDKAKPSKIFWNTVLSWDLLAASIVAAAFGISWLKIEQLRGGTLYLWPLLAASFGVAGFAWNMGRQSSDRIRESDFGELVRMVDPDESAFHLPYLVVTYVALISGVWTTVLAVATDGIDSRGLKALLYGGVAFWFAWALLGLFSLIRLTRRHDRNAARVRSIKESHEAEERARGQSHG
jgi:hypothetical protein